MTSLIESNNLVLRYVRIVTPGSRGATRSKFRMGQIGGEARFEGEARTEGAKRPRIEGEARIEGAKHPRIEGEA